jgi:hypothetical protein
VQSVGGLWNWSGNFLIHPRTWIGHIVKIVKERTMKRVTVETGPIAARRISGQRLRWEDDVRKGLGKMKIQNWSKMAVDREEWKRIVEQAKPHNGL